MKNSFPEINGVKVDINALFSLSHKCNPTSCVDKKQCCASYEVCIEDKEIDKILPHFPEAAKFKPEIVEREFLEDLFREVEDGLVAIETNDDGQCLLGCQGENGELLCSLHCQSIKNNLSFYDAKPKSCGLWPLAEIAVETPVLTVQNDALEFVCNDQSEDLKVLDKEVSSIIENIYGKDFLDQLNEYISKLVL